MMLEQDKDLRLLEVSFILHCEKDMNFGGLGQNSMACLWFAPMNSGAGSLLPIVAMWQVMGF